MNDVLADDDVDRAARGGASPVNEGGIAKDESVKRAAGFGLCLGMCFGNEKGAHEHGKQQNFGG